MSLDLSINSYLEKYITKNTSPKFTTIRLQKKKKEYIGYVNDGIINWTVILSPTIKCSCGGGNRIYCGHIYHILHNTLDIPIETLVLFTEDSTITKYFSDNIATSRDIKEKMIQFAEEIYDKIECICGYKLNDADSISPRSIFACNRCHKICHANCMESWCSRRSKSEEKGCVYCRDKVIG
jgi:hypothetical protein